MAEPFIFKQFQLNQSESAFKLGTDSVLLGCWLPHHIYQDILDIGSGTGILGLMMAQRFEKASITAVEIDQSSYNESANNFTQSKWRNRLNVFNDDIVDWCRKNEDKRFDLIVSNPPYFTNQLKNRESRKSNARHTSTLNAISISKILLQHLVNKGVFACILPTIEFDHWAAQLKSAGVYANHICSVSSFIDSEIIRKMGLFSRVDSEVIFESQYLYHHDKSRSEWYKNISQEFYIK